MTDRHIINELAGCVVVIMCVHAGADPTEFDQALASIQEQSYPDVRFYIFCDGPLNHAHEEVLFRRVPLTGSRNFIVRSDRPVGLPTGLNILIERALLDPAIKFIARMDADDISLPKRIEKQVEYLWQHSNVSILGTWCIEFSEPGVPIFYKSLPIEGTKIKEFMRYRSPLIHPTVMFRRSVFEDGYRYNTRLKTMQDYDLWSRLIVAGHIISNVPEYLLWFRVADNFFSRRAGLSRAMAEIKMRIEYARNMRILRWTNYFFYAAFFIVRISPTWLKRLAYKCRKANF